VLGLFAALLVVPGSSAKACSCALFQVTDAVANADVVLRGAISAKDDPGGGFSGRSVTYAVFVDRVYKGTAARTTYIRSAGDGGSCGIEVGIGMTYLLFPRVEGDDLVSGLCDGTTPATPEATAELVAVTGPGTDPVPRLPVAVGPTGHAPPGATGPPHPAGPPWPGLGLGAAVVAGMLWLGWRGRASAG
jgi:hypothetical protein